MCGTSPVKAILCIFNALLGILGLVIVIFSAPLLKAVKMMAPVAESCFGASYMFTVFVLTFGVIFSILSIIECYAVKKKIAVLLLSYSIILLCFLIILLIMIGVSFSRTFGSNTKAKNEMYNSISKYSTDESVTKGYDKLQTWHKCCGVVGPRDWVEPLPNSCCSESYIKKCVVSVAYTTGCLNMVHYHYAGTFWSVPFVVVFIYLIPTGAMSFMLWQSVKNG